MTAPYTDRQGQYLAYILAYTSLHGQAPSEAEMAAYFSVSPPAVHQMVLTLASRGLISRTPGQACSLRVLLPSNALPPLERNGARFSDGMSAAAKYPHLASWLADGGWVELGRTDYSHSMARALDPGGLVWEGAHGDTDLDHLLAALDAGIARWQEENG